MEFLTSAQPRGLHNFIAEIRDCKSKEEERSRVDKELGNIRLKFSQSASLTSYQKKKYVWKMCYIFMLGYDVDFGHVEFISLLSSSKFQEKSVGYMAVALFLKPGDELMTLVVNSIRNDIVGHLHFGKTLALAAVSNIGGTDLAEALSQDVQRLIVSPLESGPAYNFGPNAEQEMANRANICKKASLCLLRLFRTNPECIDIEEWLPRLGKLLEDRDLGVVLSVMSLLLGITAHQPEAMQPLVPYVISILTRLVVNRTASFAYMYYQTPSPWLQVKCLRFLRYYECPSGHQRILLGEVLQQILTLTETSDSVNKNNIDHAILVEAVSLVVSYGTDCDSNLRLSALTLLGRFISMREANIRYLGLDIMNALVKREGAEAVKSHKATIVEALREADVSVRKRSLELLFSLADAENAHEIVGELVTNLATADSIMKEDMVVKIAILTEKYANADYNWYMDTMLKVIFIAGDFIAEAVWHRIVLIVTNHPDTHEHAAAKLLECVQSRYCHDTALCLAAYLLGEIGVNICDRAGCSGYDQFAALHQHFLLASPRSQAILLTTYMKLFNLYPDIRELVSEIFAKYSTSSQLELQQRSCEYLKMPSVGQDIMEQVFNTMPVYSADKENALLTLNEAGEKDKEIKATAVKARVRNSSEAADPSEDINSPAKTAHAQSLAPMVDLLSLDDDASVSTGSVGIGSEEQPKVKAGFKAALLAGAGQKAVLYENNTLAVSTVAEYRSHQGRLQLLIYNKSNFDFTRFEVHFDFAAEELNLRSQGCPVLLTAGDEARIMIAVEALRPFADAPVVDIAFYLSGVSYRFTLKLPILVNSFFEPLPSDKNTYMTRWKALEGEVQEIFAASQPLTADFLAHMRSVVVPALKVGIAAELDTTDKTVTGSVTFKTGTPMVGGPEGALVSIGGLFRLEADVAQGRFRVTVRAKNPTLAVAMKDMFKSLLA